MGKTQDSSSFGDSIVDSHANTLEIVNRRIRFSVPSILSKVLSITLAYSRGDAVVELGNKLAEKIYAARLTNFLEQLSEILTIVQLLRRPNLG